jgi:hypothetical protein
MAWCETKECEKQAVLKMSTLIKMQFMTFLNSATTNNWDELCLRPRKKKIEFSTQPTIYYALPGRITM